MQNITREDVDGADLWLSCHGYESRSIAHLEHLRQTAHRKRSFGFDFPNESADTDVHQRMTSAHDKLQKAGFDAVLTDDAGFEANIKEELALLPSNRKCRIAADISSMNRSR